MNIYVGNMSFDATEDEIRQLFAEFGEVTSVNIISDRDSGRPKGFGFVEMAQAGTGPGRDEGPERQGIQGQGAQCQRGPSEDRPSAPSALVEIRRALFSGAL